MLKHDISILANVTKEKLDQIRGDFNLLFQGVKLFYVVDTYDIIEYCFPTLFNTGHKDLPESSLISSYLAYDFLFFHYEHKPIIVEQYKVELFSVWNEVYKETSFFFEHKNKDEQIAKIKEKIKTDKDWVSKNIGIFLSLFLGLLSANEIEKYRTLLKERLQIEKFEIKDEKDREIISDIFSSIKTTKEVPDIFEKFCQSAKYIIHGKTSEEKYAYLENAYRDIVVYNRLLKINEKIQSNQNLKGKYLFLYLSSTPSKSVQISKIFEQNNFLSSVYGNINFPIHRNISQFYLQELIHGSANTQTEVNEQLDQCDKIVQENKDRDSLISKLSKKFEPDISIFNKKITSNRKELENTYLLYKSFSSYKKRIYDMLEQSNNEDLDIELKIIIDELFSTNKFNELSKERLMLSLGNYKEEFTIQNKIFKFINDIKNKKSGIRLLILPGKDVVRSYSQLYPILLFSNYLNNRDFSFLKDFFIHLISPKLLDNDFVLKKYTDLKRIESFHLDSYEKKLYLLFLELVIPDIEQNATVVNSDTYIIQNKKEAGIIEELKKLYEINKRRYTTFSKKSDESEVYDVFLLTKDVFEIEIVYFLSWLYRRAGNYEDCLSLLNYTITSKGFDDPRLFHSRALCTISEIYQDKYLSKSYLIAKFNAAIADILKAIDGYKNILKQRGERDILIFHLIFGLINTQCDLYVKLYYLDKENSKNDVINIARPLLNNLKEELIKIGENILDYPSYNHTEADLECCESKIAYYDGNLDLALKKANYSAEKIRLIETNKYINRSDFLDKSISDIIEWKNYIDTKASIKKGNLDW